jgi:uncharacterized protein (TIGR01777 family)
MNIVITGASGFIGQNLIRHFQSAGHTARTVSLRTRPTEQAFAGADVVVHLAGEPVAQRWTAEARRRIKESRVDGTRWVVQALAKLDRKPKVLISASAVGYYGSRGDEVLTEASKAGDDFLGEVASAWEQEAYEAEKLGIRVVTPRIGVVFGQGGMLERVLLPFKMGVGGKLGDGRQWMSWIQIDDLCRLILFAIETESVSGPMNAVAPTPCTNAQFTQALVQAVHRWEFLPAPAIALKLLFGEMSEVLLGSQRVMPEVAQKAGFKFLYSSLDRALAASLGSQSTSGTPSR